MGNSSVRFSALNSVLLYVIAGLLITISIMSYIVVDELNTIIEKLDTNVGKVGTINEAPNPQNLISDLSLVDSANDTEIVVAKKTIYQPTSDFLKKSVDSFDVRYGDRCAWARPFGCGKANFTGAMVEWFAYCNTDGYLQFKFSRVIPDEILVKMINQKDGFDRNWEVSNEGNDQGWLGESNFWINDQKLYSDGKAILDQAVARINKATGIKMQVVEYLQ